jgi:Ca2+-binding RTX toxin-like protein
MLLATRALLLAAVSAAALTFASAAHAATVAMEGDVLTFEAAAGEQNTVDINRTSNGFVKVWGGDIGGLEILTPDTCSLEFDDEVWCDLPQRVVVETGDEDDTARSIDFPAEIHLGPGDDRLLSGRFGDDVSGGDGRDTVDYFELAQGGPRRTSGVTVTYDGQANDGASGEGDNVKPDVEVVSGTGFPDRLVGDDGAQELDGSGGNDVLDGGGGNDALGGSAGDDAINGGAGDDSIDGHSDSDRIDAGPGRDQVRGDLPCRIFTCGGGPDEIVVRDGEADLVQCGIGFDRVIADALDGVQRDGFEVCELVELPPPPPPPPPPEKVVAGTLRIASGSSLRRMLARGIVLTVSCPAACGVSGTASVERRTAKRLRLTSTTIARGATPGLDARRSAKLILRLDRRTRQRLRRARRLTVALRVTYRYAGGSAHLSRTATWRR